MRPAPPEAECLRDGFLGSEARCQVLDAAFLRMGSPVPIALELACAEDPVCEAVAEARDDAADAPYFYDVGADAKDHAEPALRISAT